MTSLGSLPPELLIDICHDFELSDLCAIRLTCKAVALKTRECFAKHVFKIIHVAITTEGVQFLQKIATHEFRIYVQELWILPGLFGGHHNWTAEDIAAQQERYPVKTPQSDEIKLGFPYLPPPEIPIEDRFATYQRAVTDHLHTHHTLRKTLESCLPLFPQLDTVGLWAPQGFYGVFSTERIRRKIRGVSRLKQQLGFDPLNPIVYHHERKTRKPVSGMFGTDVLSALLVALATTNVRVKSLHADKVGIVVNTEVHLTSMERGLVTSFLQELQQLSLLLRCSHKEDEDSSSSSSKTKETILSIFAEAAPTLSSLTISQAAKFLRGPQDRVMLDWHLDWMSQHFHFNRLSTFTISFVDFTVASLETLLGSALPTMRNLTLSYITLTSDQIPASQADAQSQGERVWREICIFLRDNCSLQSFHIGEVCYHWERIGIFDPIHGFRGSKPLFRVSNQARYRESDSDVTFREWIDQVDFRYYFDPSSS
ncbi:Hypothetical protein PENO1_096740 [Penicillium occitanis (nom. inval.)]|nr:hypothetical protein PENOC_102780 [Penicillium occitanis (nom. inval.)]PCG90901.1 Hypothetical protein PENO1_096740 [Penicillium occitanis (nom. inval.)]